MGVSKTNNHVQIKIKMANPSQEPPTSSIAPNQDLNDMVVLFTFKIKIESQSLDHRGSKASEHIQVMINIPNPSQEPPACFKASNEDLKDINVLGTFKMKLKSQNLDHGCIKDQ